MQPVIGCDAHIHFSVFVSVDQHGKASRPVRVDHDRERYCKCLRNLPSGSEIALEATGHWYWIVDAMEQAGHRALPADTQLRPSSGKRETRLVSAKTSG